MATSDRATAPHPRLVRLPVAAAAVGLLLTVVISAAPGIRFAYENVTLHAAFETAEALIAALLAYLSLGRLRRTAQAADLGLAWAFSVFAATNFVAAAGSVSGVDGRAVGFATWMAVGLRLVATIAFLAAAIAPLRPVNVGPELRRRVAGASMALLVTVVLLALAADRGLAAVIDPELSPASSTRPLLSGHAIVVGLQVASAVLSGLAALAFARRAVRRADELLYWLASGAALVTFARVNYVLFPSLYSNWVYTGDILRLAAYLLYLVGAVREITAYFESRTEVEVLNERRRLARDLHDGLTQELSFVHSHLASLAQGRGRPEMLPHLADAAERALHESRRAADALAEAPPASLRAGLDRLALQMTALFDESVSVTVEVDPETDRELPVAIGAALERIAREALSNALRHGRPRTAHIGVGPVAERTGWARLSVEDDGRGIQPREDQSARVGLGLTTMRERAEELGGDFRVSSVPGEGTVVEVDVPMHG